MAFWKSAMSYLGLGPEDQYDDYDLPPEPDRPRQPQTRQNGSDSMDSGAVRTIPSRNQRESTASRSVPSAVDEPVPQRRTQGSTVRAVPSTVSSRPYTVRPASFNQAQEVADRFREGQAVIMNLEGVERDLRRRLIDFASGLTYGLGGDMDKVGTGVYLLTPTNVSLSAEDKRNFGGGSPEPE